MSNKVLEAILNQYETTKTPEKKNSVDLTKYFSATLREGQKTGQKRFRIIPTKDGSPFVEVHFHEIQVKGKWRKFYCLNHNDGQDCPLCEVEQKLRNGDELDKKISKTYKPRKFYVVKGIDRDNEGEGVKFWRFKHNYKGEGIFDKIFPLFTNYGDITDIKEGRDLIISLGRDDKGYTKVNTIMVTDKTPISNAENAKLWLTDPIKWQDVYSKKPYEYLEIIAKDEEPIWNEGLQKFVPKDENWKPENSNKSGVDNFTSSELEVGSNLDDLDDLDSLNNLPF